MQLIEISHESTLKTLLKNAFFKRLYTSTINKITATIILLMNSQNQFVLFQV